MNSETTFLGTVRRVNGAQVMAELSAEIPSANPIINGRMYRLGQIGSFVKIPIGFLSLYGIVSRVGAVEFDDSDSSGESGSFVGKGQRWLEIQLVGEAYRGEELQRGISVFPTIDDEVHAVDNDDLKSIYAETGSNKIEIGHLVASESLPAYVDLRKFVTRHAAIVGSTGSGKSNTVAHILRVIGSDPYCSARVVVIDPHSEYKDALAGKAKTLALNDTHNPIIVPYWALSYDELAWFIFDRRGSVDSPHDKIFRDRILQAKKESCATLKAGAIPEGEITADSPIPFSLKKIWWDLYFEEYATLKEKDNWNAVAYKLAEGVEQKGNLNALIPPEFLPPGAGSSAPFKSTKIKGLDSYLGKLFARMRDRRFSFILNESQYNGVNLDLHDLVRSWIDHPNPITVLDLGGIPFEVMDLAVGTVTRILFETMLWGRDVAGVGRQCPLLMVYEEAHTYLPRGGEAPFVPGYSSRAVRRIFKEGRKFGIGAFIVSQRPAELDETILSQCGTFIALRLTNSDDQGRIKSSLPDTLAALTGMLPALRTGEAILVGEAVRVPSRVRIPLIEPRPKSDDPDVARYWTAPREDDVRYDLAIKAWRIQRRT